jgi:ring-1,2-phenylacetyl-CoA epoxidase subunit PaaD
VSDLGRITVAVEAVEDPEIPVTLADLGVLRAIEVDAAGVKVVLRPTRLGCPARDRMERDVSDAVRRVAGDVAVEVDWELAPWTDEDVSPAGKAALAEIGYALLLGGPARCPYCGSDDARRDGAFGGALCKSPFTCRSCGSTFDALRSSAQA